MARISIRRPALALGALFLTTIMALASLPGTIDAAATEESTAITEFRIGMTGYSVYTLNPFLYSTGSEYMTIWPLYSTMLTYDVNGAVIGDLATSYSLLPDGVTYRFELATNAFFIDPAFPADLSHPVTWMDVAWTYWEVNNEATNRMHSNLPFIIDSIWNEPGNDYVMYIRTAYPYAPFIGALCSIPILPEYIWSSINPYTYSNLPPVGSGPFYYGLTSLPTSFALLERNPNWFEEANRGWHVQMSRLLFVSYVDPNSALLDLFEGNIDVMGNVPRNVYVDTLPTVPDVIGFGPEEGFVYEFNLNQMSDAMRASLGGAFKNGANNQLLLDPVVKAAMAMCVDKQGITDEVLLGLGSPADSLVPSSNPWHYTYGSEPGDNPIAFDPAAARAFLMDNGWAYDIYGMPADPWTYPLCKMGGTDPLRFRLYVPDSRYEFYVIGSMIANAAAEAGIDLQSEFEVMSVSQMNTIWYTADYDVWVWDWVFSPMSDPSADVMVVLTTAAIGTLSDVFYSNSVYDSIYSQSLAETDPVARKLLTDELQRMAYEDMGCQCVAYADSLWAVNTGEWTNYGDWDASPLLTPDLALPWLYTQVTLVYQVPNSPPTVDVPDLTVVLRRAANVYTVTAYDPDGDALTYTWDWGDGTVTVTDTNTATHEYWKKGTYTLTVYVSDGTNLPGHTVFDSGTVVVMWPRLE